MSYTVLRGSHKDTEYLAPVQCSKSQHRFWQQFNKDMTDQNGIFALWRFQDTVKYSFEIQKNLSTPPNESGVLGK